MALIPFPFPLPDAFQERLGYHHGRRILAVFWDPLGDELAFTDGVHSLVGADPYVYGELTRQPAVRAWLREHGIDLGNSDQLATHWLLVDRLTGRAYVCDVAAARDHVRTQTLEEWTAQRRLP